MSIADLLPFLLFGGFIVLIIVLAVGASVLGARRFAKASTRLEQQSMERGWQYHGYREGSMSSHNISGKTNSIAWQIESRYQSNPSRGRNNSGSTVRYTRWWTEAAALSGEVVLLIPKGAGGAFQAISSANAMKSAPGMLAEMASSLIQMAMRHLVTEVLRAAPEDARAFENLQQVQAGSDALRQHYAVLATHEKTASRFLDEDAERLLIELAPTATGFSGQRLRTMAVVYWHKGIQFIVDGQIVEIDKLEQLVQLGLALVSGQKESSWS